MNLSKRLPLILLLSGLALIVAFLLLNSQGSGRSSDRESKPGGTQSPAGNQSAMANSATSEPNATLLASPNASRQTQLTRAAPTDPPTSTPQPISPTNTPTVEDEDIGIIATSSVLNSELFTGTQDYSPTLKAKCSLADCEYRSGVSGTIPMVAAAYEAGLAFGNYFNWWSDPDPPQLGNASFWQMAGINENGVELPWNDIGEVLDAIPGSTWIVGNEPDVIWQDNITPERYAEIYHDVYQYIKERDPNAKVAIAGVAQPTPLRLTYLDRILAHYQRQYGEPMPVDVWTVHAFILREEAGSWGVDIPPGIQADSGRLYEIEDHADLEILEKSIVDFRAWMAENGYQDRPLAVTEFGILHPADFGFPPQSVAAFMVGAFDLFNQMSNETGYPADENRLVQWWFWYSAYDSGDYQTGNLYDPTLDQLTSIGDVFTSYIKGGQ